MAFGRRRPEPEQPRWDDPLWVPQPVEEWVTPEAVADRLRRRRGRWRALRHAVVLLLIIAVVGGTGVVAAGAVLGRWELPFTGLAGGEPGDSPTGLPTGAACEPASVTAASAEGTTVTVLNGTALTGLAGRTADELEGRGFTLVEVGNADREAEAARVRYPPEAERAALAVAAHLTDEVLEPDPTVDVVTVVVGEPFDGLADREEVVRAAAEPQPSRVTCADGSAGTPAPPPAPSAEPSPAASTAP
ncbi:LytR C-terminal domain-containing protein [Aquipuribacter sp. SD81]|uniref:LytR C-terminal domain-containing protein n=1 Tax=Aquipuribacter sp. SD81 TaxID=3127703 RepID=UPI0030159BAB